MTNLNQRDPRWASIKVGTGGQTIGEIGCTLTSLAMILGTTPDVVNERLNNLPKDANNNTGFANGNLIYWARVGEAFPGITCERIWTYNNDDVLANVPCIVQVDGAPIGGTIHFVVFIGDHQLIDPWDGQVKPTSTYTPTQGYATIKGQWQQETTQAEVPQETAAPIVNAAAATDQGNYYNGYNLADSESMKVAVDILVKYQKGDIIDKSKLDAQSEATTSCQTQLKTANDQNESLQNQNKTLQQEVEELTDKNQTLLKEKDAIKKQYDDECSKNIALNEANKTVSAENQDNGQKAYDSSKLADDLINTTDKLAEVVNPDLKKQIKDPRQLAELVATEVINKMDEFENLKLNNPTVYADTLTGIVNHLLENGKLNDYLKSKGMEEIKSLEDPQLTEKVQAYINELLAAVNLSPAIAQPTKQVVIPNQATIQGGQRQNFLMGIIKALLRPYTKSTGGTQS